MLSVLDSFALLQLLYCSLTWPSGSVMILSVSFCAMSRRGLKEMLGAAAVGEYTSPASS